MPGPTLIQIKRSLDTGTTPSLANGELAFTANGDILFIGSNAATIPIASKRTPGVLTANQAIVANSLSLIDAIRLGNNIANVVITATGILLSNTDGESNTITLTSPNTTEKGGNYYLKADGSWSTVTGATADPAGANTHIQYNDSDVMGGSAGFTFDETTNNVFVGNTLITSNGLDWGGATVNVVANSTVIRLSNSTVTFDISKPTSAQNTAGDYFLGSNGVWQQIVASGSLDALTDVVIATAANNQLLVFDNDASVWENHDVGNGFSFSGQVMAVRAGTDGGLSVNTTGIWVVANNGLVANSLGLHVGTGNGVAVDADAVRVVAGTDGGLVSNATGVWVLSGNGLVTNSTGLHVGASNGVALFSDSVGAVVGDTMTLNSTGIHVNTTLSITDLTLSGNLDVNGTLTTIDATNLAVNDSIIAMAINNGADTLDIGFYGQYNDGTDRFTGLIWDTTDKTYYLYANATAEPTTTLNVADANLRMSSLRTYLLSGGLVSNSTAVNITANSTLSAALVANTLSLSTALPGTSGGTGLATIANNSLIHGNSTNGFTALALGTVGLVLQSNGTALVYDTLDGGTF